MAPSEIPPPTLIPTVRREKTGPSLSYPLGAEAISRALAGVPEFDSLRLYFGAKRTHQVRARHPIERSMSALPALEAGYRNSTRESREVYARLGLPALEWSIRVIAVPRIYVARTRELLLGMGLVLVHEWLVRPRTDTWRAEGHLLGLSYDPRADSLVVEEPR